MSRGSAAHRSCHGSRFTRIAFLAISALAGLAAAHRTAVADSLVAAADSNDSAVRSQTWSSPRPNLLFQLQQNNRRHPWLRITADSGRVERKARRLDPIGIHGISTPEGVEFPGPLTWNRIQRIDEVVTRAPRWRTLGAVTLGLLGAGLGNALGAPNNQGGTLALGGLLVFGGTGAYLGGAYGSRFRSERNWYVADTVGHDPAEALALAPITPSVTQPVTPPVAALVSVSGTDPRVLSACNRIGHKERFRAYGSFGSFLGYAGVVGPEGLEDLHAERNRQKRGAANPPQLISWDEIDLIEMRGGSALHGALIGGASFAVVGALVGMAAVAVAGSDVSAPAAGAVGALYVAPVGIVLGGLGGFAVRRWVSVYQRP